MRKIIIVLTFTMCINHIYAQIISDGNNFLNQLPGRKLHVMLCRDSIYNKAIEEAMKNYWTVSSYDFRTKEEIYKELPESSLSFLVPMSIYWGINIPTEYNILSNMYKDCPPTYLTLFVGGTCEHLFDLKRSAIVAEAPFDTYSSEQQLGLISYRLGLIIKNFNDYIILFNQGKISVDGEKTIYDDMNSKAGILKVKTLLINEELFSNKNCKGKFSMDEKILVNNKYKYKYRIASKREIDSAIKSKNKDYAYLCPTFNYSKNIIVYDLEVGEVVYFYGGNDQAKLNEKDISNLVTTIDKARVH